MVGSIIKRNGQHLVIVSICGERSNKYQPAPGEWFCIETDATGGATSTHGTHGPRTGTGRYIEISEQPKWAIVGTVSDDKIITLIKTRSSSAASALGSMKSERKSAAARRNGALGGRPRKTPV